MVKRTQSKSKAKKPVKKAAPPKKIVTKKSKAPAKKVTKRTATPKTKKVIAKKVAPKTKPKLIKKAPATKKKIAKKQAPKAAVKEKVPAKEKVQKKTSKTDEGDSKVLTAVVLKVPHAFSAYTVDQYKKYQELKKEWSQKTNKQIQEALKQNGQSKTGNKDELVNKVCDGIILGSIPRCPYCFGGRPKFNQATGTYHCVGFRDDVDFKWCQKTMSFSDLPRTPWIE